jgi:hypothetical protein
MRQRYRDGAAAGAHVQHAAAAAGVPVPARPAVRCRDAVSIPRCSLQTAGRKIRAGRGCRRPVRRSARRCTSAARRCRLVGAQGAFRLRDQLTRDRPSAWHSRMRLSSGSSSDCLAARRSGSRRDGVDVRDHQSARAAVQHPAHGQRQQARTRGRTTAGSTGRTTVRRRVFAQAVGAEQEGQAGRGGDLVEEVSTGSIPHESRGWPARTGGCRRCPGRPARPAGRGPRRPWAWRRRRSGGHDGRWRGTGNAGSRTAGRAACSGTCCKYRATPTRPKLGWRWTAAASVYVSR